MTARKRTRISAAAAALALALALALTTLAAFSATSRDLAAGSLAPARAAADPTCFWVGPYSTERGPQYNQAFPDAGAVYWTARFAVPAGATLRLAGRFAHARYQSLNSYDASTAAPIDALNDLATKPDRRSVNPFKPGANRKAKRRAYTATVAADPPPADPAERDRNTLYAGVAGQAEHELIYRVYLPDKGRGYTGGAGLPSPELELADGSVLHGAQACVALNSSSNEFEITTLPLDAYLALRDQPGQPSTFPAASPPNFRAFYNTAYTIGCTYQAVCDPNPERIGGQYSNADNNYVGAFVNREFGPVLVLRGKLPRTPRTRGGARRMGEGQLRYWSLCQNESFATTKGAGCVYDEQVELGRHRRYKIVTSLPADRPTNARRSCGVGYVPWPAAGDGAGHPNDALLLVRNMLPADDFERAVQDTRTPGDEAAVMGPFLPRGTYTTTERFEARGCRPRPVGKADR